MSLIHTTLAGLINTQNAAVTATTTNGTAVNITDYEGVANVILDAKNVAGATPTLDVKIQDSPDGSAGWADVSGATFTQVTTAQSPQVLRLDTNGCKGYIRAVATIGGTSTPSYIFSVNFLGIKKYL